MIIFFSFDWIRKYMIHLLLNQSFLVNLCDNRLVSYRILNLMGRWLDSYDGKLVTGGKSSDNDSYNFVPFIHHNSSHYCRLSSLYIMFFIRNINLVSRVLLTQAININLVQREKRGIFFFYLSFQDPGAK